MLKRLLNFIDRLPPHLHTTTSTLSYVSLLSRRTNAIMRFSILPLLIAIGSVRGIEFTANEGNQNVTATPPFDDDTGNQTASDGTDGDSDTVSSTPTPWRWQPKPLPDNFKLTASFDASNEDSKYGYTVAVAGEVASITSHTGSDNPDENDPTLYFENLSNKYGCNSTNNEPISFMTSKFQVFNKTAFPLKTESIRMCWKAPGKSPCDNNI